MIGIVLSGGELVDGVPPVLQGEQAGQPAVEVRDEEVFAQDDVAGVHTAQNLVDITFALAILTPPPW
ncbi:hypothetical protein [Virgisporangium aurantiacum]|uniref:hypothetical protein n=1 Tax=Virgisporangium aurantiacum TaxID=175570 RepID=UPI001951BA3A|nr:hypothetical protein [Virgisporangium aurantiacum]